MTLLTSFSCMPVSLEIWSSPILCSRQRSPSGRIRPETQRLRAERALKQLSNAHWRLALEHALDDHNVPRIEHSGDELRRDMLGELLRVRRGRFDVSRVRGLLLVDAAARLRLLRLRRGSADVRRSGRHCSARPEQRAMCARKSSARESSERRQRTRVVERVQARRERREQTSCCKIKSNKSRGSTRIARKAMSAYVR